MMAREMKLMGYNKARSEEAGNLTAPGWDAAMEESFRCACVCDHTLLQI